MGDCMSNLQGVSHGCGETLTLTCFENTLELTRKKTKEPWFPDKHHQNSWWGCDEELTWQFLWGRKYPMILPHKSRTPTNTTQTLHRIKYGIETQAKSQQPRWSPLLPHQSSNHMNKHSCQHLWSSWNLTFATKQFNYVPMNCDWVGPKKMKHLKTAGFRFFQMTHSGMFKP